MKGFCRPSKTYFLCPDLWSGCRCYITGFYQKQWGYLTDRQTPDLHLDGGLFIKWDEARE
jgi:hypothetical protein